MSPHFRHWMVSGCHHEGGSYPPGSNTNLIPNAAIRRAPLGRTPTGHSASYPQLHCNGTVPSFSEGSSFQRNTRHVLGRLFLTAHVFLQHAQKPCQEDFIAFHSVMSRYVTQANTLSRPNSHVYVDVEVQEDGGCTHPVFVLYSKVQ